MILRFESTPADAGRRLDHFLQSRLPQYSRSRLQQWIKEGRARQGGNILKASYLLRGSEAIEFEPGALPALRAEAEDIPLDVLYADDDVIAVNKPAGLVVHAGAGRHSGTLVNALLHRFEQLSAVGGEERPGIVHRLDADTSGVLIVARNDRAHRHLAEQFAGRTVEKTYLTLVHGAIMQETGRIDAPITRDPVRRTRMTAKLGHGRSAHTEYSVLKRWPKFTYLQVKIGTGRTHQIRVHLASIGHVVAGDRLYGAPPSLRGRFFLHASRIAFTSPSTGRRLILAAPLPPELQDWLDSLGPQPNL